MIQECSWGCCCGRHASVHLYVSDMLASNVTSMVGGNGVPTSVGGSVLLHLCLRRQAGLTTKAHFMGSSQSNLFVKKGEGKYKRNCDVAHLHPDAAPQDQLL